MIQLCHLPRLQINPGNVRAFMTVAVQTRISQVAEYGLAFMLPGDDMINGKGETREYELRNVAVFATMACPIANQLLQVPVHEA